MALLQITNLTKQYKIRTPAGERDIRAVDGIDLEIEAGETLGLVGESGCGKSTLGRCILRLIEPTGGGITFRGDDLLALGSVAMRRARRDVQIVFQDPLASLNPRMTVGDILAEPLDVHRIVPRSAIKDEVLRLLDQVGLPADAVHRFPHEFSGGQRQRVGIARAMSVRPKLIVADEPVSALDVSIRAQILNLFRRIQEETGVALLFIAHDLGAVRQVSNRVAVMYLGKIIETADSETLFQNPRHPYTRALLAAIPSVYETRRIGKIGVTGDVPSPIDMPSGCRFRNRCAFATDICAEREPPLVPVCTETPTHRSACHFATTLPAPDF